MGIIEITPFAAEAKPNTEVPEVDLEEAQAAHEKKLRQQDPQLESTLSREREIGDAVEERQELVGQANALGAEILEQDQSDKIQQTIFSLRQRLADYSYDISQSQETLVAAKTRLEKAQQIAGKTDPAILSDEVKEALNTLPGKIQGIEASLQEFETSQAKDTSYLDTLNHKIERSVIANQEFREVLKSLAQVEKAFSEAKPGEEPTYPVMEQVEGEARAENEIREKILREVGNISVYENMPEVARTLRENIVQRYIDAVWELEGINNLQEPQRSEAMNQVVDSLMSGMKSGRDVFDVSAALVDIEKNYQQNFRPPKEIADRQRGYLRGAILRQLTKGNLGGMAFSEMLSIACGTTPDHNMDWSAVDEMVRTEGRSEEEQAYAESLDKEVRAALPVINVILAYQFAEKTYEQEGLASDTSYGYGYNTSLSTSGSPSTLRDILPLLGYDTLFDGPVVPREVVQDQNSHREEIRVAQVEWRQNVQDAARLILEALSQKKIQVEEELGILQQKYEELERWQGRAALNKKIDEGDLRNIVSGITKRRASVGSIEVNLNFLKNRLTNAENEFNTTGSVIFWRKKQLKEEIDRYKAEIQAGSNTKDALEREINHQNNLLSNIQAKIERDDQDVHSYDAPLEEARQKMDELNTIINDYLRLQKIEI